jgi:hypothetical protein
MPIATVRSNMTALRRAWARHSEDTPFVPSSAIACKHGEPMSFETFAFKVQMRNHEARRERGQR